ncbi:netrin-4 isoform X3 [Ranitomeya imitator]|uniref:netrin-4 isoform X3 n=1 Tax=Ranitomeya imitator TaxID=111125 RepID=UPI0037E93773
MSAIGITGRSHPAPGICSYVPVTMEALLSLLTLLAASALATGINTITFATIASQREKACNPRMGNLAIGRSLWTDTVCGTNSTELYCTYTAYPDQTCKEPKCEKCNAAVPRLSHPASAMADSTFKIPRTWWQSARDIQREIIQLHLETTFYFTHLIMVFKSPRPAAMILEGSQDFGVSWRPYKYFSTDCTETFQLEDDINVKGAPCTSRYSQVLPCSGGEVIYRAMPPPYTAVDPYSEKAQDLLKITNLRVQLLKQQSCPCQNKSWDIKPQSLAYYAVYDFIVKGSCFCNGHADHCVPIDGFQQVQTTSKLQVVHGQCICKHNTAGPHCEQCAPLYNDRAWKAANGKTGEPNMCETCSCHPVGSAKLSFSNHTLCDPQNGNCPCKPGVAGPICDRCMVGYWGFGEYGCRPCACPGNCDSFTGDCITNLEVDWYHGPDFLSSEQGFSALRHSGKCECKDQVLENAKVFCDMRYSYVLKVKILSAHDKGSHAEVIVKIKKVLKMTKLKIPRGKRILYPESWTNRGCTCPILNPGLEYLVAGYEDVRTGHLIVNMKSFVQPWKPSIGKKVMEILSKDCY